MAKLEIIKLIPMKGAAAIVRKVYCVTSFAIVPLFVNSLPKISQNGRRQQQRRPPNRASRKESVNTRFAWACFRFPNRMPAAMLPPEEMTKPGISAISTKLSHNPAAANAFAPRRPPTNTKSIT